jgi:hypothetical protein
MSFIESHHVNNVFISYEYGARHSVHDTNITNYEPAKQKTRYETAFLHIEISF